MPVHFPERGQPCPQDWIRWSGEWLSRESGNELPPLGLYSSDIHSPDLTAQADREIGAPFLPRREIPVSIRASQIWPWWFNSAFVSRSLQTATRVANFDSEVPALNRRELGANPRRPTISASVVKVLSSSASNGEFAGGTPAGCTNLRRVSPTTRDAPLRPERLGVEIPHAAPAFAEASARQAISPT